tara:strand:- start:228 stop:395 length:168 start_codon:yes stop_codon:yes gene_type:complete
MKVKELIERLKDCKQDSLVQFYFLKNYNLNNCKLETILQADGQTEITIEENEDDT